MREMKTLFSWQPAVWTSSAYKGPYLRLLRGTHSSVLRSNAYSSRLFHDMSL